MLLLFYFCKLSLTLPLRLALLFDGVGSAAETSAPPPAAPVLMHFSSFTAFEIKGCEKAASGVSLVSVFHSTHF